MNEANPWIKEELKDISFGDRRLNQRILKIALSMANAPSLPLNQVADDWHAAKASYRLFENKNVSPDKIIAPHISNTIERIQEYPYVLIIQDSSMIDYTRHQKTKGLGNIGGQVSAKNRTQGIIMHSSIAVSPGGVPLGLVSNYIWSRGEKKEQKLNYSKPIEEKESFKWISAMEEYTQKIGNKNRR